jgi:hypothetical protein
VGPSEFVVRIMLRLSILSSVVPLVLAGGVAHDWNAVSARQCATAGIIAPAIRSVAFTDDPADATVRVQIVESAELADLTIADDVDVAEAPACGIHDIARLVSISAQPVPGEPVIHLTREAGADYRIYVDSAKISVRTAAALLVSARGGHTRLAASGDALHTGALR